MARTVRLTLEIEIHSATPHDLPALATWSANVDRVFRPAVESGNAVLLVAGANGRFPIGHMLVETQAGKLSHLLVLGGFRNQGLGSALMDEGERLLRDAGCDVAQLAVEKVNVPAIRLYERRGYTKVGESIDRWPEPGSDGTLRDVDHPAWVMEKEV